MLKSFILLFFFISINSFSDATSDYISTGIVKKIITQGRKFRCLGFKEGEYRREEFKEILIETQDKKQVTLELREMTNIRHFKSNKKSQGEKHFPKIFDKIKATYFYDSECTPRRIIVREIDILKNN